jgi:hypothetical protein
MRVRGRHPSPDYVCNISHTTNARSAKSRKEQCAESEESGQAKVIS